ncbi:MAG: alkaline phosphatase family protein [Acidilobaceae archaeon]|nr:alkaline phosphatase family protein [Acidilobaceae archaeon]
MRKIVLAVALLTLLVLPLTIHASSQSAERFKVVWISVDSANYYRLFNFSREGSLPTFKRLFEEGAHGPMTVIYPPATAVSHASLSTGAHPIRTGISGNTMHLPNTSITATVSGFDGRHLLAEPIWMTVNRSGLRAAVVSFPQSTPPAWRVDSSRVKLFNIYDASITGVTPSTLYTNNRTISGATLVTITDARNWTGLGSLGTVSRAWEFNFTLGDSRWFVLIADNTGDGRPDVAAIVAGAKDASRALTVLREGQWSRPLNTTIVRGGSTFTIAPMFKLIKIDVSDFRLYRGIARPMEAAWYNDPALARGVWNNVVVRVGAFTDGDWFALTRGWIDVETYMETVNFTNTFFREFTLYVMRNTQWDLLMTYTPVVDNVYHQFLGMLYRNMPYYRADQEAYYRGLILRTYRMVDEFVKAVIDSVDLRNTVVVVSSDHGQCPVKSIINVNAVLYNAGLLSVRGGAIAANETRAIFFSQGNVYVNLAGRETGGIVRPEEYDRVVDSIVRAFQALRDPSTGEQVFDVVMTRAQAVTLGVGGPRAGDVIIATKCGYTTTGGVPSIVNGTAVVFSPAVPLRTLVADHSSVMPTYPDLHATVIFFGGPVKRGFLGLSSSLSIAPTIAELLGIPRPRDAEAAPLAIREAMTVTQTATVTQVRTTTVDRTVTSTVERTVTNTQTVERTKTETQVRTTEVPVTKVVTSLLERTTTTVERELRTDLLAIAALIALLLGAAVGFVLRR